MSWQWVALVLLGLLFFGVGYVYGFERGVKGAREMVRQDCEKLGKFYIGNTIYHCYEIKQRNNNES